MDDWTFQEVAAWFEEDLLYGSYTPLILKHRIEGVLMLNLDEEELIELGIKSKLALRRIEVAMRKFRIRFERGTKDPDEDDGLSDMSASDTPSELLDEEDSYMSPLLEEDEEEQRPPGKGPLADFSSATSDDLVEKRRDEQFIKKELKHAGDGESFPVAGDIVRLHLRAWDGKHNLLEDTKKWRTRPVELVLGTHQLTRGLERSIQTMTKGERSTFTVEGEYNYRDAEFPPFLAARERLVYDIQLISFRRRPMWIKPLIQQLTQSEKPYFEKDTPAKIGYTDTATAHGIQRPIEEDLRK